MSPDSQEPQREGSVTARAEGELVQWMRERRLSLVVSSGADNRIIAIGRRDDQLETSLGTFDRPRALAATERGVLVASRWQVWELRNVLEEGQAYRRCDGLLTPRASRSVGEIHIDDLVQARDGETLFVSSLYGCVGSPGEDVSFDVVWMPPFLSELVAEDRCHLSGLALDGGEPGWATAYSRSNVGAGWRSETRSGGVLLDARAGEVVAKGLALPRSPRLQVGPEGSGGTVWFVEAGRGTLSRWRPDAGVERVTELPGVARALRLVGDHALVATSRVRESKGDTLAVGSRLSEPESRCGVWLVNLESGDLIGGAVLEGVVELDGLAVLEGIECPRLAGLESQEARSTVTFRHGDTVQRHHVSAMERQTIDPLDAQESSDLAEATENAPDLRAQARKRSHEAAARLGGASTDEAAELVAAVLQRPARVWTDGAERFVERCRGMLYPRLDLQVRSRRAQGDLTGTAIMTEDNQPLALSVSHHDRDRGHAEILSFWVRPDLRRKGLGGKLLEATCAALQSAGAQQVGSLLRASWHDCAIMERLLVRGGFEEPKPRQIAYRNDLEYFVNSGEELPPVYPLPEGFAIEPWENATAEQREAILRRDEEARQRSGRGWYPPALDPFQLEQTEVRPGPSRMLVHEGRVVGWMLCHELTPDTLQYTALFIDPELREGYLAAELIKEVFLRHHEVYLESERSRWRYSAFLTDARNEPIRKMIDVYFRPFNPEVTELRWTQKDLVPTN